MNALQTMLTDATGTYEIAKASGALVVITYLGLSIYAVVWKGQTFDPQSFGIGAGAVIAAMGAALKLTQKPSATP
ncbi:MAG: hypothetical protein ACP5P4_15800 [Steroidobacteraceae bacterium]